MKTLLLQTKHQAYHMSPRKKKLGVIISERGHQPAALPGGQTDRNLREGGWCNESSPEAGVAD